MPLTPSQEAAVKSAHEPLFIQAGAGTGKTFALTKRLAYGLSEESGKLIGDCGRLLTITFTNKAAGELIGRVRSELRTCGLAQEALQVDAAWISTIHSMCKRMLSAHAFDVGIDPGANLLSEDETAGLAAIAFDELLQESAQDERLAMLFEAFDVKTSVELISSLSELFALAPGGMADFNFGPACADAHPQAVQAVLQVYEGVAAELAEIGLPEGKTSYENNHKNINKTIELLHAWAEAAPLSLTWAEIEGVLAQCPAVKGGSFKEPFKTLFADCKEALVQAQAQVSCALAHERLLAAAQLAGEHVARHSRLKQELGALDTNDLLIAAYRMLVQDPAIAQEYRGQFDSVMVDEFQDTDSLQVGIVKQICTDELSTLTTVGDAQQSIYGFRGADLEVYRDMRETMRSCGSRELELTTNYRSHADILRFVEDIFSTQEFFGGEFLRVSSGRAQDSQPNWLAKDEPHVKVLLSAGHKAATGRGRTSTEALRQADARALADEFERLHAQGAAYGDMAILLQSTKATRAGAYLKELRRRGIPCIVSGGSDFFLLNEIGVLIMLLRVLANRDDDEALFDLLGSSMFDIDDDELVLLSVVNKQKLRIAPEQARLKPSLYDALRFCVHDESHTASIGILRAFETLQHALERSLHAPLSQVVREAVALSGWELGLASRGTEGGAVFANIERFCDMLDEFESLNGRSRYRASEYFRDMLDAAKQGTGGRSKLGTLVSSGNEAVQIMTIHSSKGLEFPIVAVAEFEKTPRSGKADVYSLTEGHSRYLALSTPKSTDAGKYLIENADVAESLARAQSPASFWTHACCLNRQRVEEEQQRLLYVALTRARDMLFVVTHDKAFASTGELSRGLAGDCLRAVFPQGVPTQNARVKTQAGALVELAISDVACEQEAESAEVPMAQSCEIEHIYPEREKPRNILSYVQTSPHTYSYSSIAKAQGQDLGKDRVLVAQAITLRDRGEDAETVSPVGSAFHLVAQWLAENRSTDGQAFERRIRGAARRYHLNAQQKDRLLVALDEWIGSARFAQVMSMERCYAEHAFCVDIGGFALEGFIDLLCLDDADTALVIDYKTGTSGQGEIENLKSRYELQAQCYAYALLSSGVCNRVELVFVRPEAHMEEVTFRFEKDDAAHLASSILAPLSS